MAQDGNTVKVHYTGTLADGTLFDTSRGREPLEFALGAGQMIPGFENAVRGMAVGETKKVTLAPEEAYGPRREDLALEIERSKLPEGMDPEVGQRLQMVQNDGRAIAVTVTAVADTTITIDANHPLAGKDLTFEIEVVEIR
ncbi:MAG: peptidylprolyl isomerase [Chloroflexota bacterium]